MSDPRMDVVVAGGGVAALELVLGLRELAGDRALMTARETGSMGREGVRITIVTPEARPLAIFGDAASAGVADLLRRAGIAFEGGAAARVERGGWIILDPLDRELRADRVAEVEIALPRNPAVGPR